VPPLSEKQLETVRLLAREGNKEAVIRQVIRVTAKAWRELKGQEDSPLVEALDLGHAEGAGLIVTFMRERMTKHNSMEAAKWLAERVYGMNQPPPTDSGKTTTHVLILPAPMSEAEWARIRPAPIDVTPQPPRVGQDVSR
jgi:hypothetical protein